MLKSKLLIAAVLLAITSGCTSAPKEKNLEATVIPYTNGDVQFYINRVDLKEDGVVCYIEFILKGLSCVKVK